MSLSYFLDAKPSEESVNTDYKDPHIDKLWGIHEKIDRLRGNSKNFKYFIIVDNIIVIKFNLLINF